MSTYRIPFIATASLVVEVEADSLDQAVEKAYDEMPQTDFAFSPFDLGEWEPDESAYMVDGQYVEDGSPH